VSPAEAHHRAARGDGDEAALEVSHLSKSYTTPGGRLDVLSDVSFTLAPGDSAAITGPSGSGKSTLLYILGGLESATSGRVRLGGRDLAALGASELAGFRNRQIGFVFQDHCLLPQCSVLENVLVPTLVTDADPAERRALEARARNLIERVGLLGRLNHRPDQLSGGEKQRAAIARALIQEPGLVLCDEPTGNLDEATADTVTALLLELHRQQESILIAVTHSERLAGTFPARFALAGGRLTGYNNS
jgi:lipoprotein-releasing system ATP-binding protein